eukprot:CAMPEP_0204648074 /NCGR_PEP_ID=MMETSP0718-20130828/7130_1 /ASSEMBLY_ACC=CAM_ASM_000674 /TAXON_ID=230516 /ORGANISM="Chaetoceros curvisetus" /LENGTH=42 /DNA_ID= /DNA_START= /DNA_END= /DNA_ORIENTATION=
MGLAKLQGMNSGGNSESFVASYVMTSFPLILDIFLASGTVSI